MLTRTLTVVVRCRSTQRRHLQLNFHLLSLGHKISPALVSNGSWEGSGGHLQQQTQVSHKQLKFFSSSSSSSFLQPHACETPFLTWFHIPSSSSPVFCLVLLIISHFKPLFNKLLFVLFVCMFTNRLCLQRLCAKCTLSCFWNVGFGRKRKD